MRKSSNKFSVLCGGHSTKPPFRGKPERWRSVPTPSRSERPATPKTNLYSCDGSPFDASSRRTTGALQQGMSEAELVKHGNVEERGRESSTLATSRELRTLGTPSAPGPGRDKQTAQVDPLPHGMHAVCQEIGPKVIFCSSEERVVFFSAFMGSKMSSSDQLAVAKTMRCHPGEGFQRPIFSTGSRKCSESLSVDESQRALACRCQKTEPQAVLDEHTC
ncbi:hypothetical protein AAFF_G00020300 [Aldrovandia affinis]|uniref:Uncharacterized protein n=1 Tax=Aldrovandia affinis TaxID=143900 RepID=A0AAD7WGQ0_9TELE|nr:hypothetical protein AAFF_G00020300 [Aldrovandia affinis]